MGQPPTVMPHQMMPPEQQPPQMHPPPPPPVNSYYPENPNDLTGGLPINLDSLRDGPPGSKPFYPYSTLIRYAIKGAPNQKLLLEDIYYAIESRFPYFRTAPPGWKNSVRHNLSLNPCFEKVPRPLTDRGKGSYWTVNDNVDPRTGVHRVRKKKNGKGGKGRGGSESQDPQQQLEEDVDYTQHGAPDPSTAFTSNPGFVPQPGSDVAGPSRQPQPTAFPPPQFAAPYDPAFGGLFSPTPRPYPPLFAENEHFEVDEHGNVNWHAAWRKELGQLLHVTDEQEKAGADQEWYRMMLFRVRSALIAPMNPPDAGLALQGMPPHGVPGQPPNPGDVQVQEQ